MYSKAFALSGSEAFSRPSKTLNKARRPLKVVLRAGPDEPKVAAAIAMPMPAEKLSDWKKKSDSRINPIAPPPEFALQKQSKGQSMAPRPPIEELNMPKPNAQVTFILQFHAEYGQRLFVVGGHPHLGMWDVKKGKELRWSHGDNWRTEVNLPAGSIYEYKYVLLERTGEVRSWQNGNNSVLAIRLGDRDVEVRDNWTGAPGAMLLSSGQAGTRETALTEWTQEVDAMMSKNRTDLRRARMEVALRDQEVARLAHEVEQLRRQLDRERVQREVAEARGRHLEKDLQAVNLRFREAERRNQAAFSRAKDLLEKLPVRRGPMDPVWEDEEEGAGAAGPHIGHQVESVAAGAGASHAAPQSHSAPHIPDFSFEDGPPAHGPTRGSTAAEDEAPQPPPSPGPEPRPAGPTRGFSQRARKVSRGRRASK